MSVTPTISLSASGAAPGTVVTIQGRGYDAAGTVSVTWNGAPVATSPASPLTDAVGSFSATFVVPGGTGLPECSGSVGATTSSAGASATFAVRPCITWPSSFGAIGTLVVASGNGFTAGTPVGIAWDGAPPAFALTPAAPVVAANGGFSFTFAAPPSPGDHTLQLTIGSYSRSLTYTVATPALTLSPTSGASGSYLSVYFSSFPVNSPYTVTFNGVTRNSGTTTSSGAGSAYFQLSAMPAGPYPVVVSAGGTTLTATYAAAPQLTLGTGGAYYGYAVSVSGASFAASTAWSLTLNGLALASGTTDANGAFSGSFTVPDLPVGNYPLVVTAGATSASTSFGVGKWLVISPTTGSAASPPAITVAGHGHFAGLDVQITFDGTVVGTVTPAANGSFSFTFTPTLTPVTTNTTHTISSVLVQNGIVQQSVTFTQTP